MREEEAQATQDPDDLADTKLPFLRELHGTDKPSLLQRFSFHPTRPTTVLSALVVLLLLAVFQLLAQSPYLSPYAGPPPTSCPSPNPFVQELYCRAPQHTPGSLYGKSPRSMALAKAAERVAAQFEYSAGDLNSAVQEFIREMDEGLAAPGQTMSQIPTYVTAVPNGTEKGLYMAIDLGGTNFRVCSIQLHGNQTFSLTQSKVAIPRALMQAKTSKELFRFLAKQIELFLKQHHEDHYTSHKERRGSLFTGPREDNIFSLGFTFSFPVHQVGINQGKLIRWTKGFDIPDAIGKDVCALLQAEIDALGLPVRVAALVNDTVGTLMARSYTSPGKAGTLLGAIFGTGTNGAYVEKLERISKLQQKGGKASSSPTGDMIVNTEWGSFDNPLAVLPNTPFDAALDAASVNPGIQMFEKRVSGMFLGEILRRCLLSLLADPKVPLFHDDDSNENDIHSTTNVAPDSPLYRQWGLDTSFLSITSGDSSAGLKATRQALAREYGVSAASAEDAEAVRLIASAIGKRAARLSAVAIAAVIISTDALGAQKARGGDVSTTDAHTALNGSTMPAPFPPANTTVQQERHEAEQEEEDDHVDIGVDGSLVEFYPRFEEYIRAALRQVPEIGAKGEKRIRIGIAKDGSGVGAALIALVADKGLAAEGSASGMLAEDVDGGVAGFIRRYLRSIDRNIRIRA